MPITSEQLRLQLLEYVVLYRVLSPVTSEVTGVIVVELITYSELSM